MPLLHRLLLCLPPETAHHVAVALMKVWQWWRGLWRMRPRTPGAPAVIAALAPLRFPNRVGLAAGFDKNAEVFPALAALGFGFLEVGTVTPLPQEGNPRPRLFRKPGGALVNHMGFNNCGLDRFRKHLERLRPLAPGVPILGNVGKNKATPDERAVEDYRLGFQALERWVDGFVVNVSSPNTPGLVRLQSTAFLESLESVVPEGKPVLVKFSPDLEDGALADLCRWVAQSRRLAGVVVTNTSRRLAETLHQAPAGGLSGRPLRERSLHCVGIARRELPSAKVVVGVGGITSVEDARAFREAGADLIEIYTAFVYRGPGLIRDLAAAFV